MSFWGREKSIHLGPMREYFSQSRTDEMTRTPAVGAGLILFRLSSRSRRDGLLPSEGKLKREVREREGEMVGGSRKGEAKSALAGN